MPGLPPVRALRLSSPLRNAPSDAGLSPAEDPAGLKRTAHELNLHLLVFCAEACGMMILSFQAV